jgi:LPS-assembly protein
VELRQRLVGDDGGERLRLDLGQGFELGGPTWAAVKPIIGEAWAGLATRIGWFVAQGLVRYDPVNDRRSANGVLLQTGITRVGGRAEVDDARGHGAYVTYENLLMEGTAGSRQPLDLLFLIDRGYVSATRTQQLTFGFKWNFGPVGLRYDALVFEQLPPMQTERVLAFTQHSLAVGFTPACDCWRVDVIGRETLWPTAGPPNVGLNISVARFGSLLAR